MTSSRNGQDQVIRLSDGRVLGFAEVGDLTGTPVFHFHGWPGSRLQGQRYAEAARAVGVRLISPDRAGYGLSMPQPGRRIGDWPADVEELADELGITRFAVLGVSGGGPYALACAAALPARLTGVGVVSSVAPFDAPGVAASLGWRERALLQLLTRVPLLLRLAIGLSARVVRRDALVTLRRAWQALPPADRAIVCQPEHERRAVADVRESLRDGGQAATQDALLLARPWGFALERVSVPVDLWHGAGDTVVPLALGRSLAAVLPDCRARFLLGEGHYLAMPRAVEILRSIAGPGASWASRA